MGISALHALPGIPDPGMHSNETRTGNVPGADRGFGTSGQVQVK